MPERSGGYLCGSAVGFMRLVRPVRPKLCLWASNSRRAVSSERIAERVLGGVPSMYLSIIEPFNDSDTWFVAWSGFALNQGAIVVFELLPESMDTKAITVEALRIAGFLELEYQ